MKIKIKIALQYTIITTVLMTSFASVIYWVSNHDRRSEFYKTLYKEGASKANFFFQTKTSPDILRSIYENNVAYIDEVQVDIFDSSENLLYNDAADEDNLDLKKKLIKEVATTKHKTETEIDNYQVVAFNFSHLENDYIIMVSAYDGYGYNKQHKLIINLLTLTSFSIVISFLLGYFLSRRALKPVAQISEKMKNITGSNLDLRLYGYNEKDEFGELAASFNKALDIIESSFESQKMFVSNVSHELRTPLAILVGEIDLALLKQRSIEEYINTLEYSKKDVERLIKLVNGLLDLARASYDESKIKMSLLRIDEILLDARELVLKNDSHAKVNLQFSQIDSNDLRLSLYGSEYLLKTAFLNLIENGCKFSQDRSSTIQISSDKQYINISFLDNGIGIDDDDLKNIFSPFFRGKNKDFAHGSGIGLALVKRVIAIHKGIIEIRSTIGMGTIITVSLPLSDI